MIAGGASVVASPLLLAPLKYHNATGFFYPLVLAREAALRERDGDREQLRDTLSILQKNLSDI